MTAHPVPVQDAAWITSFSGRFACLSMFWRCPVVHDGIDYPGGEWAFQAAKTMDPGLRMRICSLATAGEAKRYGRGLPLRADWETVRYAVMLDVNRDKYARNPGLATVLAATGIAALVEGNYWGDDTWGAVPAAARPPGELPLWQPDPADPRTWLAGRNWLGHALMTVRRGLQGRVA
jgi:ribA/ribD-fused uncharacterized protein